MRKEIAVSGYSSDLIAIVGVSISATVIDISTASTKTKIDGNGILLDGYEIQVSAITDPGSGATIPDPGPYNVTYTSTATKTKDEGKYVLRKDNETAIISANPQIPGSPPVVFPVSFKYKISNAGQDRVLGD